MPLSNLDLKRVYYYVICSMAFFVLMWGVVDFTSASLNLVALGNPTEAVTTMTNDGATPAEKGEQFFDNFYQQKMLQDRLWDSLARVLVSGIIFGYCRFTIVKLERGA